MGEAIQERKRKRVKKVKASIAQLISDAYSVYEPASLGSTVNGE